MDMNAFESKMVAGKWRWRARLACGLPAPPSFQSNNFNILQEPDSFPKRYLKYILGSHAVTGDLSLYRLIVK